MENSVNRTAKSCILKIICTSSARVHFVGILGSGMMPLARLLRHRGLSVSGTDRRGMTERERELMSGIGFSPRHTAEGLDGVDLVVYSLAVSHDTPELRFAKERQIPAVTRADLLGAVASMYATSVAVCGTHGKSTTVAILTHILSSAGMSPTAVSGAALMTGDSLLLGGSDLFVMEACEYKNAFHAIRPTLAVITNIDHDHADFFPDIDAVANSFRHFAGGAGRVMLNGGCPVCARLAFELGAASTYTTPPTQGTPTIHRTSPTHGSLPTHDTPATHSGVLTYGTSTSDYPLVDYTLGTDFTEFTMLLGGEKHCFTLPVAGWGNLMDSVAAISAAYYLGVPVSNICTAIASFHGIERRIQHLGSIGGRAVYYDYAHHPREIENTLDLLKRRHGSVGVIFRPHTYSRTAAFLDGFRSSLCIADAISLVDVYAARESETDGVTSAYLADYIGDRAAFVDPAGALDYILTHSHGAIVLMGAGEVDGILEDIKKRLDA